MHRQVALSALPRLRPFLGHNILIDMESELCPLKGRVLYDAFVYAQAGKGGAPGFLVEYDARPSEAPPLLAMLKRYVLRSKVKLRDVSEEYDVWAAWGSEKEKTWDDKRKWGLTRNDFMTPEWDENAAWPWGTTPGVIQDRRAPGMGHRLLVRKGNRRGFGLTRAC